MRGRDKCKEYRSREEEDQLQLNPQECETGSNPRTWDMRRLRINQYTGIVELASSPGHTSSNSTQIKDQLQPNPQGEENAPNPRTRDTRRPRIKLYTGIVELASSAGHKSSSSSIQLNRAKPPTQEDREVRGSRSSVHTKTSRTGQVKRMLRKLNQTCKWRKGEWRRMGTSNKKKNLRFATWNKGGANQQLKKKVLEIEAYLNKYDIDYLGITEANLRKDADLEEVTIKGYNIIWDKGRENPNKENSRVVVYIKEELSYEVMHQYMGGDMMPEVWLKLGHARTKRTLVGTMYREHTPWGTKDGSQKGQETRLKRWLETRREIWSGKEEAYMLGDVNLDWLKKDDRAYRSQKMMNNLCEELQEAGWVQLIQQPTHFNNSAGRLATSSLIDHIWTNLPSKVSTCRQEELGTSDHEMVWVDRMARQRVEKVKMTEKRSLKNFRLEDLEARCRKQNWEYVGKGPRTKEMLEDRVRVLSEKIRNILESVALMRKKKLQHKGKPKWMSKELEERMSERASSRKKAKSSRIMDDELEARKVRNTVTKQVRKAKQEYLKKNLENLEKNSPDAWAAVGEHLGWRKPMAPTMLIQNGDVKSTGKEMADAMIKQYEKKEMEVIQSLGPARDDYLETGRRLTQGNKAVFSFKRVTKEEVMKQIASVDNKESFGNDEISYGFLKKMSRWIAGEMAAIMNLSLDVRSYPGSWKIA